MALPLPNRKCACCRLAGQQHALASVFTEVVLNPAPRSPIHCCAVHQAELVLQVGAGA